MTDKPSGSLLGSKTGANGRISLPRRYAIALLSVATAVLLRWILIPVLHDNFPFITLYGAVAIAVWYAGWRPAALASLLGYIAARYLFFTPTESATFSVVGEIVGLTAYGLSCGLIVYFGARMQRANDQLLQLFQSTDILEDALTKEKELLATTLASIGDAVIVTDAQGHVTSINDARERCCQQDRKSTRLNSS